MDPDAQQPQNQMPPVPQQELHQEVSHSQLPKALWIALGVIIVLGLIGGSYYLGVKKGSTVMSNENMTVKPTVTTTISQTTSPTTIPKTTSATANWKTYTSSTYSINYPSSWTIKSDPRYPTDESLYDPTTMTNRMENGGSTISVPTTYVNITTQSSLETPKQYADERIVNNPAYTGVDSKEHAIVINGLQAEMYMESGEGSQGYDIVVSNGGSLVIFNIPYSDITQDATINQILSSFKFK